MVDQRTDHYHYYVDRTEKESRRVARTIRMQ